MLDIWYERLYGKVEGPVQARGFGGRAPNQSSIESAVPVFTLERIIRVDDYQLSMTFDIYFTDVKLWS